MNSMARIRVNSRQVLIGCVCLLLGMAVYLLGRPAWQFGLLPDSLHTARVPGAMAGQLGDSLPSLLHVLGFSVLSAGIIATSRKGYLLVCALWLLINVFFEILQSDILSAAVAIRLSDTPIGHSVSSWLQDYSKHAVFDYYDLLALLSGAVCAYWLLTWTRLRGG